MLAAVQYKNDDSLELIKLVLTLLAQDGDGSLPEKLKNLFIDVVREATLLAKYPGHTVTIKHPESISLALKMKSEIDLVDALSELQNPETMFRPQTASRALTLMDAHPA